MFALFKSYRLQLFDVGLSQPPDLMDGELRTIVLCIIL